MSQSTETAALPTRRSRRGTAILAVAAGTALLLGGGGTYAYWSTQTALTSGPVESGDLDLSLGTGTWTLQGVVGAAQTITDLTDVRIVPGDVLTLTQPLDVTLVGDTIAADLTAELGSSFTTGTLGTNLDVVLTVDSFGTATGANTYRVTPADSGATTAELTITFDPTTPDQVGANQSVDLDDIAFSLTQASS